MQPQYVPLCNLQPNLVSPGAPVMVISGTLLQHTPSGQLFAQLIFENLDPTPILSMKLELTGLDPADRPLTQGMEHFIMDLNAPRGGQFGGNYMFPMPHPAVRGFSFRILEVIFADKRIWNGAECLWAPLPASVSLEAALEDAELAKQYRLTFGQTCQFAPIMLEEVYLCSCGAANRHHYPCSRCGATPIPLSDDITAQLRENADKRLAEEAQQAEQQRQLEAAQQKQREEENARKAEQRQKKKEAFAAKWATTKKKLVRTAIWSAVAVVLIFALLAATHFWILPEINYRLAMNAIQQKDYENAYRLFVILDDYRDAEEYRGRFAIKQTLSETTYDYSKLDDPESTSNGTRYAYKLDRNGIITWKQRTNLTMENGRFVANGEPEIDEHYTTYTYNSIGNPTEKIEADGTRTVYSYNTGGKLSKKEIFSDTGKLTEEILYTYDSNGNLSKEQFFEEKDLTGETTYTYSSTGNVTKITLTNQADKITQTHTYEYDSKDRPTKHVKQYTDLENAENSYKNTTTYTYTITGKLAKEETESTKGSTTTYNCTYNLFDQLVEYEYVSRSETLRVKQTYKISYNPLGQISNVEGVFKQYQIKADKTTTRKISAQITCRLDGTIQETELSVKNSDGTSDQEYEEHIQYDSAQQVISDKIIYEDGRVRKQEYEYQYFYFPENMLMPSEY